MFPLCESLCFLENVATPPPAWMRCRASAPLSRNEPACAVAAVGTVDRIIEDLVPLTLSGTRSLPLARPLARRSPPSLTSIPLRALGEDAPPVEEILGQRLAPLEGPDPRKVAHCWHE